MILSRRLRAEAAAAARCIFVLNFYLLWPSDVVVSSSLNVSTATDTAVAVAAAVLRDKLFRIQTSTPLLTVAAHNRARFSTRFES